MTKLTEEEDEELRMVLYFWEERGDPTRYIGWEAVVAKYPQISEAWARHRRTVREADMVFKVAIEELRGG